MYADFEAYKHAHDVNDKLADAVDPANHDVTQERLLGLVYHAWCSGAHAMKDVLADVIAGHHPALEDLPSKEELSGQA